jgi:hypothetical protein
VLARIKYAVCNRSGRVHVRSISVLNARDFDSRVRKLVGCLFTAAIFVAPFIALLYDIEAGLLVMAVALAATTYVVWDFGRHAAGEQRKRLALVAILNASLAVICVIALIVRTT